MQCVAAGYVLRKYRKLMEKISKIPASETVKVACCKNGAEVYIITSKLMGGGIVYTLYEVVENGYCRLGKGPSPLELENKFHVW